MIITLEERTTDAKTVIWSRYINACEDKVA